jgi:hypothetical protein
MNIEAWRKRWEYEKRQREIAQNTPGMPVPGTGIHRRKRKCRCGLCIGRVYQRPRKGGGKKPL